MINQNKTLKEKIFTIKADSNNQIIIPDNFDAYVLDAQKNYTKKEFVALIDEQFKFIDTLQFEILSQEDLALTKELYFELGDKVEFLEMYIDETLEQDTLVYVLLTLLDITKIMTKIIKKKEK